MADVKRCNRCGNGLDIFDLQEEFIIHNDNLGYGTIYDGDSVHLQLCCKCFERLIAECVVNPITERE